MLYKIGDCHREKAVPDSNLGGEPYRSPFRRDYSRLIHSPSFRRLQGKTQLFPGIESDFFRNRLTHSLEVAQIAKSIALRLNYEVEFFKKFPIDTDLVEIAALAHDLGHPPFGHTGEDALDECMKKYGGFEGNAQTLRILCRLEKKDTFGALPFGIDTDGNDRRLGLNLTYRTLAAILKYDNEIPLVRKERNKPVKGYYASESELVKKIKDRVLFGKVLGIEKFKTLECYIMDVSDDIAYSTYDLDDSLKAGFLTPLDLLSAPRDLLDRIAKKVSQSDVNREFTAQDVIRVIVEILYEQGLFDLESFNVEIKHTKIDDPLVLAELVPEIYRSSKKLKDVGYFRAGLTSRLVGKFVRGVECHVNKDIPALSKVTLKKEVLEKVEVLKHFTFESLIMSPRLKVVEHRGKEIVQEIFRLLSSDAGYCFMPDDFRSIYESVKDEIGKKRVICDFIAGMTDRYAVEFYGRLKSESPQTIFKPF